MAEYIEREALLEALDYNPNQRCLVMDGSTFDIVLNQPAADVVAVVRCEECEHWKEDYGGEGRCVREGGLSDSIFYYDDFCSYGERRGDDGN